MNKNALYFPYINIPQNRWLIETLLYWDKLSSIVPYEFTQNTTKLDAHMQKLYSNNLVELIEPIKYLGNTYSFEEKFIKIADKWKSINISKKFSYSRIHVEKIGDLGNELVHELKIAKWENYPWLLLPTPLANIFMSYLAIELAKNPNLDATPLTDISNEIKYIQDSEQSNIRKKILNNILPIPKNEIYDLNKVIRFKQDYGHLTSNFRQRIEYECNSILNNNSENVDIDEKILEITNKLQEEKKEIEDAMRSISDGIIYSSILPLFGTLAGGINSPNSMISASLAIASTIYQIVSNLSANIENRKKPLAYATLVEQHLYK